MAKVSVRFMATQSRSAIEYCLLIHVESEKLNRTIVTTKTDRLAEMVRALGSNIYVEGLGYSVDVPDFAVHAIMDLAEHPVLVEEVPMIPVKVDEETLRLAGIHEMLVALELIKPTDTVPKNLWFHGKNCTMSFFAYPDVSFVFNGSWFSINAHAEGALNFLRRMLREGPAPDELEMFRGISMLSEKAKRRKLAELACGKLKHESLAVSIAKAMVKRSEGHGKTGWRRMEGWLRRNGFEDLARKALIQRTLIEENQERQKYPFLRR